MTNNKNIFKYFEEIMDFAHWKNWLPDWEIVKNIYNTFPDSYSVLTPFAYAYLEELIRTTTSDYGTRITNKKMKPVGLKLLNLAINENKNNKEYIELLKELKKYFKASSPLDRGTNRNSVNHGYTHPIEWEKEAFENLIHDIAKLSKYSKF